MQYIDGNAATFYPNAEVHWDDLKITHGKIKQNVRGIFQEAQTVRNFSQ